MGRGVKNFLVGFPCKEPEESRPLQRLDYFVSSCSILKYISYLVVHSLFLR